MTDAETNSATGPTAALLTPRGRGAVATVQLAGDCRPIDDPLAPLFRAANRRPMHAQAIDRIVFGHWGDGAGEEVVLCRTGKRTLEIHCHGGEAAARRILSDLESRGCPALSWAEQNARVDGRFQTECDEALSRATTVRTADLLLEQQSGVLRVEVESIRRLAGDAGEDSISTVRERLGRMLRWASFGSHLSNPWSVVLAGRPNVGKSSLINALLGFSRSIVYDEPGTTRDLLAADTAFGGWPVRLYDTAGLRDSDDTLESAGMVRARQSLAEADCRVLLFDTSRPAEPDDHRLLAEWPDAVCIAHKCDLPNEWGGRELPGALSVSSVTGAGLEELIERLIGRLVPEIPLPGTAVPVATRQAELLARAHDAAAAGNKIGIVSALDECLR